MSEKVYLNGRIVAAGDARLSVANPAFLHGVGLFETLRAYGGQPFLLRSHIERMRASAAKLRLQLGAALDAIPDAVTAVLAANELSEARIRFTVTPPDVDTPEGPPTVLVTARPTTGYPPELYEKGMSVCICDDYRQSSHDPLAGHKTTSYFPRLAATRVAAERHCGEALWFTPDNRLAEGSISNVFLVKGGELITPPVDTPVLPGITRALVLELAREAGLTIREQACTIHALLDADEVFLTNAMMEVMPVTRIERHAIGDEKVGPITRRLREAYAARVAAGTAGDN